MKRQQQSNKQQQQQQQKKPLQSNKPQTASKQQIVGAKSPLPPQRKPITKKPTGKQESSKPQIVAPPAKKSVRQTFDLRASIKKSTEDSLKRIAVEKGEGGDDGEFANAEMMGLKSITPANFCSRAYDNTSNAVGISSVPAFLLSSFKSKKAKTAKVATQFYVVVLGDVSPAVQSALKNPKLVDLVNDDQTGFRLLVTEKTNTDEYVERENRIQPYYTSGDVLFLSKRGGYVQIEDNIEVICQYLFRANRNPQTAIEYLVKVDPSVDPSNIKIDPSVFYNNVRLVEQIHTTPIISPLAENYEWMARACINNDSLAFKYAFEGQDERDKEYYIVGTRDAFSGVKSAALRYESRGLTRDTKFTSIRSACSILKDSKKQDVDVTELTKDIEMKTKNFISDGVSALSDMVLSEIHSKVEIRLALAIRIAKVVNMEDLASGRDDKPRGIYVLIEGVMYKEIANKFGISNPLTFQNIFADHDLTRLNEKKRGDWFDCVEERDTLFPPCVFVVQVDVKATLSASQGGKILSSSDPKPVEKVVVPSISEVGELLVSHRRDQAAMNSEVLFPGREPHVFDPVDDNNELISHMVLRGTIADVFVDHKKWIETQGMKITSAQALTYIIHKCLSANERSVALKKEANIRSGKVKLKIKTPYSNDVGSDDAMIRGNYLNSIAKRSMSSIVGFEPSEYISTDTSAIAEVYNLSEYAGEVTKKFFRNIHIIKTKVTSTGREIWMPADPDISEADLKKRYKLGEELRLNVAPFDFYVLCGSQAIRMRQVTDNIRQGKYTVDDLLKMTSKSDKVSVVLFAVSTCGYIREMDIDENDTDNFEFVPREVPKSKSDGDENDGDGEGEQDEDMEEGGGNDNDAEDDVQMTENMHRKGKQANMRVIKRSLSKVTAPAAAPSPKRLKSALGNAIVQLDEEEQGGNDDEVSDKEKDENEKGDNDNDDDNDGEGGDDSVRGRNDDHDDDDDNDDGGAGDTNDDGNENGGESAVKNADAPGDNDNDSDMGDAPNDANEEGDYDVQAF